MECPEPLCIRETDSGKSTLQKISHFPTLKGRREKEKKKPYLPICHLPICPSQAKKKFFRKHTASLAKLGTKTLSYGSRGLMVKALVFGTRDWEFESSRDRMFFFSFFFSLLFFFGLTLLSPCA